jgi:hypothetical protein
MHAWNEILAVPAPRCVDWLLRKNGVRSLCFTVEPCVPKPLLWTKMTTLQLSNLCSNMHKTYYSLENELREKFSAFGEVTEVVCDTTDYGTYIGTGSVTFKDPAAALKASHEMEGVNILDKPLEIVRE